MATARIMSLGEDRTISVDTSAVADIDLTTADEIRFLVAKKSDENTVLITKTKTGGGVVPSSATLCGVVLITSDTADLTAGDYVIDVWIQQTTGIDTRVVCKAALTLKRGLEIPSV